MNNIELFNDTQNRIINNEELKLRTRKAANETKLYGEHFISMKSPRYSECTISVEEGLTLQAAKELTQQFSRVAALNFANPIEPGGGVTRGASSQEEYLCRASNLYNCLVSENAKLYYETNRNLLSKSKRMYFASSDLVLYSSYVTVFRNDVSQYSVVNDMDEYIDQAYSEDWYDIDILTCAAPYHQKYSEGKDNALSDVFHSRIRNILETAIDNDVEALVLGAFGCGAFHNSPFLVADAFRLVMNEDRYRRSFRKIVYKIKRTDWFCKNIEAFELEFCGLSVESSKRRFFQ
jgi:uncharacterized protein (TIGR02452 family)